MSHTPNNQPQGAYEKRALLGKGKLEFWTLLFITIFNPHQDVLHLIVNVSILCNFFLTKPRNKNMAAALK